MGFELRRSRRRRGARRERAAFTPRAGQSGPYEVLRRAALVGPAASGGRFPVLIADAVSTAQSFVDVLFTVYLICIIAYIIA